MSVAAVGRDKVGVRPDDGLISLFSTDRRSREARLRRRRVTVRLSFLDNLGRATPSASWSDSAGNASHSSLRLYVIFELQVEYQAAIYFPQQLAA